MKKCNKIQLAKVQQSPHDRIVQNVYISFQMFYNLFGIFPVLWRGVLNMIVNWLYSQAYTTQTHVNITDDTKVWKGSNKVLNTFLTHTGNEIILWWLPHTELKTIRACCTKIEEQ